ncbi:MAG: PD40 domain-containing protein, partial [Lewinella sp.]|nr:PD40 domain-containing protein [Lewinella sp.]
MLIRLRHIAILGLLIALSGPLYGQARNNVTQRPCPELNTIKNRLDQAIAQEQFRDALDQLSALRACDTRPEQQSFIDTKYEEVIDAIEAKRNEADSLRNEAVRTVAQLERARNDLERSLVARQQALSQAQSATTAAVNAQTKAEQALELAEQRRRTALANVYLGMVEDIGQILEANTDYDPEVVANDLSVMLTDFTYRYVDSTLSEMAGLILRLYHRDALHDIIDPAEDRELASQPMQIFDMSWSPAENLAALATSKQGVVILDQPNSNTFIQLRGPQTMANAVVWSPDGNRLAGAYDRELVIWNRNTWEPTRRPIDLPSSILVMAWDPSGERLAVGCTNGKVYLVDIRTGGIGAELTFHIDYIRDLAWSSDGKRLATASDDRKVAIWNTTTWDTLSVLRGHNDWVRTVAWHPSDTLLVTGGDDNQVIWWDTRNWQVRDVDNFESYVNQVDFDPSGDQLLVATWTGQFVLLGVDDDRRQQLTDIPPEMEIGRFSWSGDGLQVLAGGQHQAVFLYQMGNGELYFDQALDLEGGDERNLLTTDANQSIELVKWSPRGDVLAAVSTDGTLRLFDHASDPKRVRILQTDQKQITALAWSPDGNRIVTASEVGLLKIWHTGNDSLGLTIATANQPLAVDWSPDGETLAFAGSGGTIYLYNVELQQYSDQLIYHNRPVRALAWSPVNDGYLASVDDEGRVVVWNTVTGVPTLLGRHTDWGRAVAWLNGNRQLVSASDDKHTIIWSWSADRQMGVPRDTIVENSGYHLSLAISDNGNALAIGTAGGKVTFWKLDEPDGPLKIGELLYTDQMVSSLSWRPGGSLLGMNAPKGIPRTILTGLLRAEFGDWEIDRTEGSRKQRTRLPIFSVEDYGNTFTWQPEHANFALIEGDQRAVIRRNLLNEDVQPILEAVEGIELSDLLWSPHGRRLAARTMDNHLQVWEILKGRGPRIYRLVYPEENADYINDWVWSDNGALLAAISNKGALFVWDLKVDSLPVHTFYSDKEEWLIEVTQLFFMPNERDGLVLVTSDKIRQWDFADSTDEVGVFDERFSFGDAFWFGQHHPLGNGKWLFVPNLYYGSSFDDYQLTAPMEITITNSGTFPLRKPFDDLLGVNAHAVSPDGTLFAGAPVQEKTQEAPLVIWDYRTGQPKGELNAVRELELIDLAISPDNRLIAISGNERNNYYEPVVQLWDWQREALLFS